MVDRILPTNPSNFYQEGPYIFLDELPQSFPPSSPIIENSNEISALGSFGNIAKRFSGRLVIGVGSSVGGAVLGGALGTLICPGVGTVVGSGLGAAIFGGTGEALSQVVIDNEDKIQWGGVIASGALSGITGGAASLITNASSQAIKIGTGTLAQAALRSAQIISASNKMGLTAIGQRALVNVGQGLAYRGIDAAIEEKGIDYILDPKAIVIGAISGEALFRGMNRAQKFLAPIPSKSTTPTAPSQLILKIVDDEVVNTSSPRKTLIVVNAKDLDCLRAAQSEGEEAFENNMLRYSPLSIRGSSRSYEWEAVLTGRITLKRGELAGRDQASMEQAFQDWFPYDVKRIANRKADPFDRVYRVFPNALGDLEKDLRSAIAKTGAAADSEHTTLVMLYGHGGPGDIEIGLGKSMAYETLLDLLDQVPGKKALIVSACYSGSCIPVVRGRPNSGDYAVITSTRSNERGINWLDDIFHERLQEAFLRSKKLSSMGVKTLFLDELGSQSAQTFFGFDARL